MEITVNGNLKNVNAEFVSDLMVELQIKTNGIALAINQAILPFKNWEKTALKSGDSITIIKATQGG